MIYQKLRTDFSRRNRALTLSINAKGEIFIQEAKLNTIILLQKVLAVSKNRTDTRIYVRGDKTINYGRVLEIMGLLSGSGFTKVENRGTHKQR